MDAFIVKKIKIGVIKMVNDLKIIKKKYGEAMMHLCRELFNTIIDRNPGLLSHIIIEHFNSNRLLYEDIVKNNLEEEFKSYIYSFIDVEKKENETNKNPSELLKEAGYTLYECHNEEDIQGFKKYYAIDEELCTFKGGRLNRCHVFFAVKDNAEEIKRENYKVPQRQDEYGTSVISIQFTKDNSHTLSIKNRYNHTVNNPDATFSNNLDNIKSGLTKSFETYYGMIQKNVNIQFEIPGYVMGNNGKYYKYNYEIDNVYYCPDNIIIDNFEVKEYPKESYIVLDYFILDLRKKEINLYDKNLLGSFRKSIGEIQEINIKSEGETKKIIIKPIYGEEIIITIDKTNKITGIINNNVKKLEEGFLYNNKYLKEFVANNLEEVGSNFLYHNNSISILNLPSLKRTGNNFLFYNKNLKEFRADNLEEVGSRFLFRNNGISTLNLPSLKRTGSGFLSINKNLKEFRTDNLEEVGDHFLNNNTALTILNLPNLKKTGDGFLSINKDLKEFRADNLEEVGDDFLNDNTELTILNLPNLKRTGDGFLESLKEIEKNKSM